MPSQQQQQQPPGVPPVPEQQQRRSSIPQLPAHQQQQSGLPPVPNQQANDPNRPVPYRAGHDLQKQSTLANLKAAAAGIHVSLDLAASEKSIY
jgi:hypothetical protein